MEGRALVEEAMERIRPYVRRTPLVRSDALSEALGVEVHLKLENLQRTGSFKVRGALNKVLTLSPEARKRGVIAASAGNHAQGVALAAKLTGAPAVIVMPERATIRKVDATRRLGAEVVLHGRDYQEAQDHASRLAQERSLTMVHPFNDPLVMAGQGTILLEIEQDLGQPKTVLAGVGGGGLAAGQAMAARAGTEVIGVEPAGAASMHRALQAGKIVTLERVETIADGLAARAVGEHTFEAFRKHKIRVVVAEDEDIAAAILHLLEEERVLAEGAGAASIVPLLTGAIQVPDGPVVAIVSGGNIDTGMVEHILDRGRVATGRLVRITTVLPDVPGTLRGLLDVVAQAGGNVEHILHDRRRMDVDIRKAVVTIEVETRGPEHRAQIIESLRKAGYDVRPA